MANAFPLNDVEYLADDLRRWFVGRESGILNITGTDFSVSAAGGMLVSVNPGQAYLHTSIEKTGGLMYWTDTLKQFHVQVADTSDRYDYIAVRYSKEENSCTLKYVVGTGVTPTPVRTNNIYEIILAYFLVPANAGEITQANIVDTRLNSKYCGLCVDTLTSIPTDSYEAQMTEFIQTNQSSFTTWFESIKGTLDGDTAAKLANQITTLQDKVTALEPYKAQVDTLNAWKQSVLAGETTVMIFEEES